MSPDAAPLVADDLVQHVEARAPSRELAESTLRIAGISALAMAAPDPDPEDADGPGFWRAAALTFDPDTRALRRALEAARHAAGGSAFPGMVAFEWENTGFGGSHREDELKSTFDVLAILGLGPSAAAQAVLRAEALVQLVELEQAVWRARFAADRAQLRLAASVARCRVQAQLLEQARAGAVRGAALHAGGQLSSAEAAAAQGLLHVLQSQAAALDADAALRRAELLRACGLPPATPALGRVGEAALERLAKASPVVELLPARTLLERLPRLRIGRMRYALAEAEVRLAAAETWPALRVGPRWRIEADGTLPGGILALELPSPFAGSAQVDAAVARRAAAREAVEDALQRTLVDQTLAQATLAAAAARMRHTAQARERRAQEQQAGAARLAVEPTALAGWLDALEQTVAAELAHVDSKEQFALARLSCDEALCEGIGG